MGRTVRTRLFVRAGSSLTVSRVKVALYGGLNEIGGNKFLVEEGDDRVLLDFGTGLGSRNQYFDFMAKPRTLAGLRDLLRLGLLPDIDGIYRRDLLELGRSITDKDLPEPAGERPAVHGILVTHAHLDHFGDLPQVDPRIPVHCSATTRAMLEAIEDVTKGDDVLQTCIQVLGENKRGFFPGGPSLRKEKVDRVVRTFEEETWFDVGPFRAFAIPVDHSVAGAVAFLLETPSGKRILYTGDVRFHGSLADRTEAFKRHSRGRAPDLLLAEGTRIGEDEEPDNEQGVRKDVERLVADCTGLALVEFGWKDTTRFDTLQQVAEATGRTLVIHPKLAFMLARLHDRPDVPSMRPDAYENVRVYLKRRGTLGYHPADYNKNKVEAGYLADWDQKTVRAAYEAGELGRLATELAHVTGGVRAAELHEHPEHYILHTSLYELSELFDVAPPPGSRWLRCLTEPYSDEMSMDLDRQKRWLAAFGLEHNVTTDTGSADEFNGTLEGLTHVSGHAGGRDLVPFIQEVEASAIAPVHVGPENLGRYEGLAPELHTFPTYGFRDAAKGRAVIEL